MTNVSEHGVSPGVVLRVPGLWRSQSELAARLPARFRLRGERLVTPAGRSLWFEGMPADQEFPNVFRCACHRGRKGKELRALNQYKMNAVVAGPGGSLAAARQFLEIGAALIRAGGLGVFVDNGLVAHVGADWLELTEHRADPNAVWYSFANIIASGGQIASHGMHVFGLREGVVEQESELPALEDFLRTVCARELRFNEGEIFWDSEGQAFRLCGEPDRRLAPSHPTHNPFGRWRLRPVSADDSGHRDQATRGASPR